MDLSNLQPSYGSTHSKKRLGRGHGSGTGKTAGKGHKGHNARSGGGVKPGFEGGQMPLQRRLPKFGFSSRIGRTTTEVRLHELAKVDSDIIDLVALKAADIIGDNMKRVRVILSGKIEKAVTIKGLAVTKGAKAAIEAAGGKVEV